MKEPPSPPCRCVKTSLKNVVKDDLVIEKLTHTVLRANSIMIHTLKLYLLHCCEEGDELPTLDRQFVTSVIKVLCEPPSQGRSPKAETQATPAEDIALPLPRVDRRAAPPGAPCEGSEKDNVRYDIQYSPQDYLPCMLPMMRAVEAHGTSVKNACPLCNNVVPKHVRIDITSLVYLCFTKEHGKRSDYTTKGNLVKHQDSIWGFFFKTNMKCFRTQGYTFDHQIETDGVGCSILLKREDLLGKPVIQAKEGNSETYIDEVAAYEP